MVKFKKQKTEKTIGSTIRIQGHSQWGQNLLRNCIKKRPLARHFFIATTGMPDLRKTAYFDRPVAYIKRIYAKPSGE